MNEEIEEDKLQKLIDKCNECKFSSCEQCNINWTEVQAINSLLDLYNKQKERIEELEEKDNKIVTGHLRYEELTGIDLLMPDKSDVISKDKIKVKIEKIDKNPENISREEYNRIEFAIEVLQELLEE